MSRLRYRCANVPGGSPTSLSLDTSLHGGLSHYGRQDVLIVKGSGDRASLNANQMPCQNCTGDEEDSKPRSRFLWARLIYLKGVSITNTGAGDENRTRIPSLEGWCSAIELHLRIPQPELHGSHGNGQPFTGWPICKLTGRRTAIGAGGGCCPHFPGSLC